MGMQLMACHVCTSGIIGCHHSKTRVINKGVVYGYPICSCTVEANKKFT